MEGYSQPSFEDQAAGAKEHDRKHPAAHVETFERPEGTYQETSFLYEPMEAYKDDIALIEVALTVKRTKLSDMEKMVAAYGSVPSDNLLHRLDGDVHKKIDMLRQSIDRLELLYSVTQQRLMQLARQEGAEKDVLESMSTDIEH